MRAPDEFVTLYQREHPRLVGVLVLLVGDRSLAEELAQETLIRACRDWRRCGTWTVRQHGCTVSPWTSPMSSHRRRRAERRMLERVSSDDRGASHDPDAAAADAVRQALLQLPIELRTIAVLRFYVDSR